MANKLIDLVNITKSYGDNVVLDDLDLYIRENEFLTLLGPSGCGKTTTLRIIGGFEHPDKGKVMFDGSDITQLPPNKRQLNTVFQKYALFTHMTIAENIAFGLKLKNKSKAYIDDKIKYALKLVNLDGYENRKPDSLSGGQQQRIAIARAIVNEPKILLLDEPLGALDLKLRQDMQYELIRLKNELGITFIYVTHDQEEALTMSDTIVVMNQGYIQQIGDGKALCTDFETASSGYEQCSSERTEHDPDRTYLHQEDEHAVHDRGGGCDKGTVRGGNRRDGSSSACGSLHGYESSAGDGRGHQGNLPQGFYR